MAKPLLEPDQRERLARVEWMFGYLGNQRYILECDQAWNKVVELKDEANVFTAIADKLGFTGAHQVMFSPSSLA